MATNFPGSVDDASTVGDDTHPSADELLSSTDGGPAHHALHQNVGLAINAIEDKVGTGASTPVVGSVLTGTGSGTSGWSTDPLYVDEANSRVGVGTTSPGEPLHIVTASDDAFLKQENGTTTTFSGPDSANTGLYGTSSNHDTRFITNNTERVRITSSGNVGIGTASPAQALEVEGQVVIGAGDDITPDGTGNGHLKIDGNAYSSFFTMDGTGTWIGNNSNGRAMILATDETARLTVGGTGNVGIGVTSPAQALDVAGNIALTGEIDGPSDFTVSNGQGEAIEFSQTDNATYLKTLGASRLTIDSSGNVGIGTTSPAAELDVSAAVTPKIQLTSEKNGTWVADDPFGEVNFYGSDTSGGGPGYRSRIRSVATDQYGYEGELAFRTTGVSDGDAERMRIDQSGRVGIGTTSPSTKLEVADANPVKLTLKGTNTIVTAGSEAQSIDFYQSDASGGAGVSARIVGVGDNASGAERLEFHTGQAGASSVAKRMSISSSGAVSIVGSLSKGSGSFRIPHPLPAMAETHDLVHSFVEAPQADNLYRGRVALVDGAATVDLDDAAGMTTGTFELLNRDLQCFIVNNESWTAVRGSVSGSTLTIEAQDASCADTVDWLVIGERHDQHMYDTEWTDDDGRVIVEPLRPAEPEPETEPEPEPEPEAEAVEPETA